jgi:NAD(P)-dependent dehydrogenase (short-subunit alcohol dehydrogenase family)
MEVGGAVVLITGASSGIGAAAARAFDRAGARLALAARRRDRLEALAAELGTAVAVPTDLAAPGAAEAMVDAVIDRYGRIDVLINNAATMALVHSDSLTPRMLRDALQANFLAPMIATQRCVPHMRRRGSGQIINVGSPGFLFGVPPMMTPYNASKGALSGWTRSMQAEWAGSGIFVTEYFPGHVDTGSLPDSDLGEIGPDFFRDRNQSALVRWLARPQDPAEVGEHLVACVRRPRPVAYSSLSIRFTTMLAAIAPARVRLGAAMARSLRLRLGVAEFSVRLPLSERVAPNRALRDFGATRGLGPARKRRATPAATEDEPARPPSAEMTARVRAAIEKAAAAAQGKAAPRQRRAAASTVATKHTAGTRTTAVESATGKKDG